MRRGIMVVIALTATSLLADVVHLRGAGRITGEIVEQTEESVTVNIGGGLPSAAVHRDPAAPHLGAATGGLTRAHGVVEVVEYGLAGLTFAGDHRADPQVPVVCEAARLDRAGGLTEWHDRCNRWSEVQVRVRREAPGLRC